ncbi:Longitudinals lacking protein, isoforms N/O/W/X/Y [Eufriesea mexicana]|nr:Longitudinals lacking protein, isoforms N/O/W/X/Y [Eufriesea mexicana]
MFVGRFEERECFEIVRRRLSLGKSFLPRESSISTNRWNFVSVSVESSQYPVVFKHTCATCGKTYKHKHHLKRHHDFECGIDPKFKCAFCPHRTRYKDSLMKHILARHQHLHDQNPRYRLQQVDALADVEGNVHIQGTMFASYHDFSQNL